MSTATRRVRKKRVPAAQMAKRRAPSSAVANDLSAIERAGGDGTVRIESTSLKVSNLGKVYFPKGERTKGDVMRYYANVAPVLLPVIDGRPLVLKRFPDGVEGQPFFQQNAGDTPPGVRSAKVPADSGPAARIIGGDLATLLYCVQLGAIEVNPWHVRIDAIDTPDLSIIDLDPGPKARFSSIVDIAVALKGFLDNAKITAGIKTSGSRGLHIVIPLPPGTNEEACQLVAHVFAQRVANEMPEIATVVRSKNARPDRAVYVDYLQNVIGKSVASAFSIRARPEATISMPLSWDELTPKLDPKKFTMDVPREELLARGKVWLRTMRAKQSLSTFLRGNEE